MKSIVLSLFDFTTNMVRPWAEAGYECICVDMQHPDGVTRDGLITRVGADIMDYLPPRRPIEIVFGFPPCTHVAVSGARWFKDKGLGGLVQALTLFDRAVKLAEWAEAPYMLENPVSTVSSYWRNPDYTFDPCDYGDPWTKRTCLWTGNGFVMPVKARVEPTQGSKMHLLPPSVNRANLRSETSMGFARAVFQANTQRIEEATS